jgi:hypothetical protein
MVAIPAANDVSRHEGVKQNAIAATKRLLRQAPPVTKCSALQERNALLSPEGWIQCPDKSGASSHKDWRALQTIAKRPYSILCRANDL